MDVVADGAQTVIKSWRNARSRMWTGGVSGSDRSMDSSLKRFMKHARMQKRSMKRDCCFWPAIKLHMCQWRDRLISWDVEPATWHRGYFRLGCVWLHTHQLKHRRSFVGEKWYKLWPDLARKTSTLLCVSSTCWYMSHRLLSDPFADSPHRNADRRPSFVLGAVDDVVAGAPRMDPCV